MRISRSCRTARVSGRSGQRHRMALGSTCGRNSRSAMCQRQKSISLLRAYTTNTSTRMTMQSNTSRRIMCSASALAVLRRPHREWQASSAAIWTGLNIADTGQRKAGFASRTGLFTSCSRCSVKSSACPRRPL